METIFINEFRPFYNKDGEQIESALTAEQFNFLGGEVHVKIKDELSDMKTTDVTIYAHANNSDDVMSILLTNDALYRMGYTKINLFIPYMPYARQDRVMVAGEPFSLKVVADMINSCGFNKVIVFDPHSDVSIALLNNCHVINNSQFVNECLKSILQVH
jgi:ribose-phosphate pyrophosphokinase